MLFRIFKKWFSKKNVSPPSETLIAVQEFQRKAITRAWLYQETEEFFLRYEKWEGDEKEDEELLFFMYKINTWESREKPEGAISDYIYDYWIERRDLARKKRALNNDPLRFC